MTGGEVAGAVEIQIARAEGDAAGQLADGADGPGGGCGDADGQCAGSGDGAAEHSAQFDKRR